MNRAVKITACCIWFGFVVWLSHYGDGFFFKLVNLVETKVIRAEIPPEIDFAITIIPWNCFISLLVCLPVWLMKKRRAAAANETGTIIVFFFWLLGWNLSGMLFWLVCFPESIGNYSGAPSLSVIEAYAANDGWSPFELWCTWWGFIIVSNAFSAAMAFLIKWPRQAKANQL
jgi:hypothetical protein